MPSEELLPRKTFEEFPEEVAKRLRSRVARLGYLGEFFRCAVHQPEALAAFIDFTETGKGSLPPKDVELIALTCSGWFQNAYERNQHERLSVRLGFGRDWVAAVNALDPEKQKALSPAEQRLQRLVLRMLNTKGSGAQELFEAFLKDRGAEQGVAVLMMVGRYLVHGLFINTLGLKPPVPSIFEDGFTG
jgi:hypothetical protein